VLITIFIEISDKKEFINKNWEFLASVNEHFKPSSMFNVTSDAKNFIITTCQPLNECFGY